MKSISRIVLAILFLTNSLNIPCAHSLQNLPDLPPAGAMVRTSSPYSPVILRGLGIHGDNPLAFDFIVDKGETGLSFDSEQFHQESIKLVKYFLASLTVPEKAQWVNLSPYEKDHMLGAGLRDTGMGYDLLAQDYILKQLSASLLYPEEGLGREFWEKVYKEAKERFGITEIPHDAFNKVWIVPDKGVVYETGGKVLVLEQRLKVLLEQDYLATQVSAGTVREKSTPLSDVMKQVMREIVIPRIEKEVNEGRNFATLRQIYNSMILAVWYKKTLRESLLGKVYVDRSKVAGVDAADLQARFRLFDQYVDSFKVGVYNYIKEELDPETQQLTARKYVSGGVYGFTEEALVPGDKDQAAQWARKIDPAQTAAVSIDLTEAARRFLNIPQSVLEETKKTIFRQRRSGVLLHFTSLPSRFGIGDLGPVAYRFIDYLAATGQTVWQALPIGPTFSGDSSPYNSLCVNAGNELLISPELLVERGWLSQATLDAAPFYKWDRIKDDKVRELKAKFLDEAFENFNKDGLIQAEFDQYVVRQLYWLEDYALFVALHRQFGGISWRQWPHEYKFRDETALKKFRAEHLAEIRKVMFGQFVFDQQMKELRAYAHSKNVKIFGDMPVYPGRDGMDAWAHPDMFNLDKNLDQTEIAGVPPDAFSATGQVWGNPTYRWDANIKDGFSWWISRLKRALELFDYARIDHFRGLVKYFAIPSGATNGLRGEWKEVPTAALFDALRKAFPQYEQLSLIAENLGIITPDVTAAMEENKLPGMAVLQFADLSNNRDPHIPNNATVGTVFYVGTHDNPPTQQWAQTLSNEQRATLDAHIKEVALDTGNLSLGMQMYGWAASSNAALTIVTAQDLLNLGKSAMMNVPGVEKGSISEQQIVEIGLNFGQVAKRLVDDKGWAERFGARQLHLKVDPDTVRDEMALLFKKDGLNEEDFTKLFVALQLAYAGPWSWQLQEGQLENDIQAQADLLKITMATGRMPAEAANASLAQSQAQIQLGRTLAGDAEGRRSALEAQDTFSLRFGSMDKREPIRYYSAVAQLALKVLVAGDAKQQLMAGRLADLLINNQVRKADLREGALSVVYRHTDNKEYVLLSDSEALRQAGYSTIPQQALSLILAMVRLSTGADISEQTALEANEWLAQLEQVFERDRVDYQALARNSELREKVMGFLGSLVRSDMDEQALSPDTRARLQSLGLSKFRAAYDIKFRAIWDAVFQTYEKTVISREELVYGLLSGSLPLLEHGQLQELVATLEEAFSAEIGAVAGSLKRSALAIPANVLKDIVRINAGGPFAVTVSFVSRDGKLSAHYRIVDKKAGTALEVAPEDGFRVYHFIASDGLDANIAPMHFGFPIGEVSPQFDFNGKHYDLNGRSDISTWQGHYYHPGAELPWSIEKIETGPQGVTVTAGLEIKDDPMVPGRAYHQMSIGLAGNSLVIDETSVNKGEEPIPDLLGIHPWFEAEQNNGPVRLELDADTTIAFPGNAKRPVHAGNDLRSEPEIISGALLDLNDTYQPKINNGSWRAWLTNGDRQVRVEADAGRFPWATMWTQWPGIVGMEPTASVRDPFALPQDHPLLQNWIQPGQQKQGQVRYTIITRQDVIKAAQDNRTMTPQELAEKTGASLKFVQDALEAMQKNERLAGLSEHVRDAVNRTMNGEPTGGLSRLRSFLTDMTGIEEGYYIATDWGGTNLRVLLVHAIPGQKPVTLHQYTVKAEFPKNYVAGEVPIEEVMDFVASKIAEMVGKIKSDGDNGKLILQKTLNMGAGFSFPTVVTQEDGEVVVQLEQNNIKGWAFPGLSVEDVKKTGKKAPSLRKLHQDAIDRNPEIRGLVKVMAMPNDVVALGLAIAGSSISFIDGTGFNMGVRNPLTGEWINLEFGAFDDISSGLITDMDRRVFEEVDPGVHKFEKMVSGKYLIELLRRQVADKMAGYTAIQKLFAFPEIDSRILTFAADDKMSIEQKNQGLIEKFGTDLGLKEADWRLLQEPSRYYLARSGELIGAVLSGVLEAIDPERKIESPIIAYDGSAINNPIVMSRVKNKMAETGGRKVEFRTTNDATGIGTAIAAALKPMDAAQQTGGVNLDPAAMDFQIRRDGKGVPLSLSSQPVKDLRIDGFSPRIIGIRPVSVVDLINK